MAKYIFEDTVYNNFKSNKLLKGSERKNDGNLKTPYVSVEHKTFFQKILAAIYDLSDGPGRVGAVYTGGAESDAGWALICDANKGGKADSSLFNIANGGFLYVAAKRVVYYVGSTAGGYRRT